MNNRNQLLVSGALILLAGAAVTFYTLAGNSKTPVEKSAGEHQHGAAAPGGEAKPVRLDPQSAERIGVTYATAEYGALSSVVRTVGQVTYDETKLVNVNPKIEGWVEKLYVDFTGAPVRAGQPLLAVYSPMLVSAQEELILARKLLDNSGGTGVAADNARELLESARRRLSYWDVPSPEVEQIERTGMPQKTVTLRAPSSGLVVEKNVFQGQRIMPGMDLYRIADLSRVWVEGEVFEKDLSLVAVGRSARISFESYPGRTFVGRISYVYPTITSQSRTGRIRIELPNLEMQFKPGMYAQMEFDVPIHRAGVHIPRLAVLQTGERSIVFVRAADGSLVPREIQTGVGTSDHIEVLAGLRAGEVVVASANFLIDAESNLGAAIGSMLGLDSAQTATKKTATPVAPAQHKH
jgi:membrane fusion protein, copper/silver efflux system